MRASRHIQRSAQGQAYITELRKKAYFLLNNPDEIGPQWRVVCRVLREFVAQNPNPPYGPRDIAKFVDDSIAYRLSQGVPLEKAVPSARRAYAQVFGKTFAAVKADHLRHGRIGVAKPRKL